MLPTHYSLFETARGHSGIAWNQAGVARLTLPSADAASARQTLLRRLPQAQLAAPPDEIAAVIVAIQRYFRGERVDFGKVTLDLEGQDDFFQRIYAAARALNWGSTTTYGTLAKSLGAGPEGARDVGQAMARNPVPLIIPCHRVLAAGGKLGGFSAPGGAATKLHMLELEGIRLGAPPEPQQSLEL